MALIDDLADGLSRDTLAVLEELGDDRFYEKVSRVVGQLSPTLQEAFITCVRLRLAEQRGRSFLNQTLAAHRAGGAAPAAPRNLDPGGH